MSNPLANLEGMQPISAESLAEKRKIDRLRPGEREAVAAYGESRIERRYRKDGNYSWSVKLQTNDHGKVTADGHKLQELVMPWARADSERQSRIQAAIERTTLKDEAGSAHYLTPAIADRDADRNGWHHAGRPVGVLARAPHGNFCPRCDRRVSWCECDD
jgi:hypothetical protein